MKQHLIINTKISLGVLFFIVFIHVFFGHNISALYYIIVPYFCAVYLLQYFLIYTFGNSPIRFQTIYIVTTMIKMLVSAIILVLYYSFFAESIKQKNHFTIYFITIYFTYLIVNTKTFFIKSDDNQK